MHPHVTNMSSTQSTATQTPHDIAISALSDATRASGRAKETMFQELKTLRKHWGEEDDDPSLMGVISAVVTTCEETYNDKASEKATKAETEKAVLSAVDQTVRGMTELGDEPSVICKRYARVLFQEKDARTMYERESKALPSDVQLAQTGSKVCNPSERLSTQLTR
jgi:hypothetical protein